MYWTTFLVAATGLFFFCFRAFAGTITTSITCRNTVKSKGASELHMDIRNNGDVTACNMCRYSYSGGHGKEIRQISETIHREEKLRWRKSSSNRA